MVTKRIYRCLLAIACLLLIAFNTQAWQNNVTELGAVRLADLPEEAQATLALVKKGGPFLYKRDGIVFQNRERRLPIQPRGYYREYTVPTPGSPDRGPRRIVSGRSDEFYYSADHYRSFRRIKE